MVLNPATLISTTTDLQITNTALTPNQTQGNTVTYSVVVTNSGSVAVANALVTDTISTSLFNVTSGPRSEPWGTVFQNVGSGNTISQFVSMPANGYLHDHRNGEGQLTGSSIPAFASITDPAGVTDSNYSNNFATAIVTVTTLPVPISRSSIPTAPTPTGRVHYLHDHRDQRRPCPATNAGHFRHLHRPPNRRWLPS